MRLWSNPVPRFGFETPCTEAGLNTKGCRFVRGSRGAYRLEDRARATEKVGPVVHLGNESGSSTLQGRNGPWP